MICVFCIERLAMVSLCVCFEAVLLRKQTCRAGGSFGKLVCRVCCISKSGMNSVKVFDAILVSDAIDWNTLIAGYAHSMYGVGM